MSGHSLPRDGGSSVPLDQLNGSDAMQGEEPKLIPCNCRISYSRGFGKHDNTPDQRSAATFAEFRNAISADRGADKGQQWIAGPCSIAPADDIHTGDRAKATAIGRPHRCRHCVAPRRWIGLDIDGVVGGSNVLTPEAFAHLVAMLQGRSGLVYTTASSTLEAPRCRIILELDEALPRAQLIQATKAARARIDAAMVVGGYSALPWDDGCDKPEQPLYLPTVDAQVYMLDGIAAVAADLLADALTEPVREMESQAIAPAADRADSYALAALDRALRNVASAPEGTRNELLNREAHALGGFVGQGRLARGLVETALIDATANAQWENAAKNEATVRSAIASGTLMPRTDGLPDEITMSLGKRSADCRLKPVSLVGLRTATIVPPAFVLHPLIPCGTLTLFGGHGGSGKSLLALIWAAHVACGRDWAGFRCSGSLRCLYVSLEDPGDMVQYRLRAIVDVYNLDYDAVERNLVVVDGADIDASLVTEVSDMGTRKLRPTPRLHELGKLARGAGLILIDNASDSFDGDENNRRQVRFFIGQLTQIARANAAGLVLLAHIDKNAAIHGSKGNSYSGSTAWHNSARSRLALEGGKISVTLRHEKANLSALARQVTMTWKEWSSDCSVLVPVDHAHRHATDTVEADQDCVRVLNLMELATNARADVPAATRGSSTAAHALSDLREYPACYKDKQGRARVCAAILQLRRDGLIEKVAVKSSSRNTKDVLKLTQAGLDQSQQLRASIPHTPSVTDARAQERASVVISQSNDATHQTHETHASGRFIFSQHSPGVMRADLPGFTND